MAKRVLFLDDNKFRHNTVQSELLHDAAFTATEAIELMKKKDYDLVFLDHDLGDEIMVDSFGSVETGYTVAKWMVENKPKVKLVIVHSMNPAGSDNIANLLKDNGYYVLQQPFCYLKDNIKNILNWK